MKSFIYTRIHNDTSQADEEMALAMEFLDPDDNPLTDVTQAIQDAKTIIARDEDDDDGHDCPIAWMYEGLVDAR